MSQHGLTADEEGYQLAEANSTEPCENEDELSDDELEDVAGGDWAPVPPPPPPTGTGG